jgi:L-ascorbate metabolism protein UlaG (beta-lactamase superfamily)
MKITKFVHSCLLVEMPAPVNRTALFDPGSMSQDALDVSQLKFLDDIFITHEHPDHWDMALMRELVDKFPDVNITATQTVVDQLRDEGIAASVAQPEGVVLFDAPHEPVEPLAITPIEQGYHYLDLLTDPGDSHHFAETKQILALPVTAPWGSAARAINLALELKPKYVLPIHDWHWSDEARAQMYDKFEEILSKDGITFVKLETGVPVVIEV